MVMSFKAEIKNKSEYLQVYVYLSNIIRSLPLMSVEIPTFDPRVNVKWIYEKNTTFTFFLLTLNKSGRKKTQRNVPVSFIDSDLFLLYCDPETNLL